SRSSARSSTSCASRRRSRPSRWPTPGACGSGEGDFVAGRGDLPSARPSRRTCPKRSLPPRLPCPSRPAQRPPVAPRGRRAFRAGTPAGVCGTFRRVADRLSRLIELAYDAAVDRQGWRGLLEGLAAATDSDAASFNLQDLSSHEASVSCQVGADERAGRSYEQYYAAKNVFLRAAPELHRTGMVVNGEALVPDRDLLKTEYFNDFLRPLGLQHMVGVVPFREHTVIALLSL